MSPKGILTVDSSFLPESTEFFLDLKKKKLFQILGLTGSCIEGNKMADFSLTGSKN